MVVTGRCERWRGRRRTCGCSLARLIQAGERGACGCGGGGGGGAFTRVEGVRLQAEPLRRSPSRCATHQMANRSQRRQSAKAATGQGRTAAGGGAANSREQQLVDKLRRIEALHARPGSEGERQAAARARERIQERLKQLELEEPPIEVRFTLSDQWSRHLFVALLRRYGVQPYRYRGQRRTTVMARLSRAFVNETLWPEFQDLQSSLAAYFDALTDRVIEQALEVKAGEAEERSEASGAASAAIPRLEAQDHQGSLL